MPERGLYVAQLGCVPYGEALELQRQVARLVIGGRVDGDVLLLLEHPPVVTLGRSSKQASLVASPEFLANKGVELFEVERGGDVTFHGPGQLVGYPIFDLKSAPHRKDLHWYLRAVEESLIRALASVGITGLRNEGYTGVWVGDGRESQSEAGRANPTGAGDASGSGHGINADAHDAGHPADRVAGATREDAPGAPAVSAAVAQRKIASIGVHARDWVTWHGFALNVTTDLTYFDLMIPCGIPNVQMTSVARELAGTVSPPNVEAMASIVTAAFAEVFGLEPLEGSGAASVLERCAT